MRKSNPHTNPTNHELHVLTLDPLRKTALPEEKQLLLRDVQVRTVTLSAVVIEGKVADGIGANYLQQIADAEGLPVLINGASEHHGEKVFHPKQHLLSMERMVEAAE